jgi:hypothetical protein
MLWQGFFEVENCFCNDILLHFSAVSDKCEISDVFYKAHTDDPEQLSLHLNLALRGKQWKIWMHLMLVICLDDCHIQFYYPLWVGTIILAVKEYHEKLDIQNYKEHIWEICTAFCLCSFFINLPGVKCQFKPIEATARLGRAAAEAMHIERFIQSSGSLTWLYREFEMFAVLRSS